jgi:non-canonical (house-cleaning) NTP pyrophosphatase
METLIIHTEKEKLSALKDFLKEMNITFEVKKSRSTSDKDKSPYDPEFVKMILERTESANQGNTITYDDKLRKELFGMPFSNWKNINGESTDLL